MVSWPAPMKVRILSSISSRRKAVWGPPTSQQQCQEIAGHCLPGPISIAVRRRAIVSETIGVEALHDLAAADAGHARHPFRREHDIHRIDAAHMVQQLIDALGKPLRLVAISPENSVSARISKVSSVMSVAILVTAAPCVAGSA